MKVDGCTDDRAIIHAMFPKDPLVRVVVCENGKVYRATGWTYEAAMQKLNQKRERFKP